MPDAEDTSRIARLVELLREMSIAQTPLETLRAWSKGYWPLRPVDYMMSLSTRDLDGGRYRITREINVEDVLSGRTMLDAAALWRARDQIPTHLGGFLGEVIAERRPRIFSDLKLMADPVIGDRLASYRSAIFTPLFHEGQPVYWNLNFRRRAEGFSEEDLERSLIISNLVGGHNSRLLLVDEVRKLNSRLVGQLEDVARVQRSLLPKRIPTIPGLEIATSYLTSDQAGGDYYDFFPFDDGTWGILIADVAGHGPAAATIMAMLHGILHTYVAQGKGRPPDAVLRHANSRLVEAGIEGTFVTAFFAVYDPSHGTVTYARAGHNPPLFKDGRTGTVTPLDGAAALPLGVLEPMEASNELLRLRPQDTLILYTDGITEAFSASGEMFGPHRLDAALTECSGQPDCVVDSVHGALFRHTGARTRIDDQTLVAIRYNG